MVLVVGGPTGATGVSERKPTLVALDTLSTPVTAVAPVGTPDATPVTWNVTGSLAAREVGQPKPVWVLRMRLGAIGTKLLPTRGATSVSVQPSGPVPAPLVAVTAIQ